MDNGFYLLLVAVFETLVPFGEGAAFDQLREQGQGLFAVAPDGYGGFYVLIDLGGVDVEMDDPGLFGVFVEAAGDAIVEAHADGDEHVAIVCEEVGAVVAVHAEHPDVQWMIGRECAEAEEGPGRGDTAFFDEGPEFLFRLTEDDALAEEDEGAFSLVYQCGGFCDVFLTDDGFWAIAADMFAFGIAFVVEFLDLGVLGDVDEHGSGAAAAGDVEGFCQCGGDLGGVGDLVVPFCDRRGDIDHVCFLEGVCPEEVGEDLAGDTYDGGAVDHRVGEAGDEVGGAGTAGGEYDAGAPGSAGIALCGVDAALFVADKDMVESVAVVIESVIDRHDRAAGVAEDGVDAFGEEGF